MNKYFNKLNIRENPVIKSFMKDKEEDLTLILNIDGEEDIRKVLYNACKNIEHAGDHTNFKQFKFPSCIYNKYVTGVTIHDELVLFEVKEFNNEGVYLKRVELELIMTADDSVMFLTDRIVLVNLKGINYGYYPALVDIQTGKTLFKCNYIARLKSMNYSGKSLLINIYAHNKSINDKLLILKNNRITTVLDNIKNGHFEVIRGSSDILFKIDCNEGDKKVIYFNSTKGKFKELYSYDKDIVSIGCDDLLWSKDDNWYTFNKITMKSNKIDHCSQKNANLRIVDNSYVELCIDGEYFLIDFKGYFVAHSIKENSYFSYTSNLQELSDNLFGYTKTDGSMYIVDRNNCKYEVPTESVSRMEKFANELLVFEHCVDHTALEATTLTRVTSSIQEDELELLEEVYEYVENSQYGGTGVRSLQFNRNETSRSIFMNSLTKEPFDKEKSSMMILPNEGRISLYELSNGKLSAIFPGEEGAFTFNYFIPGIYEGKELILLFNTRRSLDNGLFAVTLDNIEGSIWRGLGILIDDNSYEVFNIHVPTLEEALLKMVSSETELLEAEVQKMRSLKNE